MNLVRIRSIVSLPTTRVVGVSYVGKRNEMRGAEFVLIGVAMRVKSDCDAVLNVGCRLLMGGDSLFIRHGCTDDKSVGDY